MKDSSIPAKQTELSLKPRLLDQLRDCLRRRHYSLRTEKVYVGWIRRFILFHGMRHPKELGPKEVTAFLSHLARREHVAAATQNQALSALLFLYRHILDLPLPWLDDVERAKRPVRLPTVLTVSEVRAVLAQMEGTRRLMTALLYGAGLRLLECLGLRVKDVGFEQRQLIIRDAKGFRDQVTVLPDSLAEELRIDAHHRLALNEAAFDEYELAPLFPAKPVGDDIAVSGWGPPQHSGPCSWRSSPLGNNAPSHACRVRSCCKNTYRAGKSPDPGI